MKIIFFSFLLITAFSTVSLFSCPFDDCINDGLTKATAYEIWTLEHLYELRDSVNSTVGYIGPWNWAWEKHFRLMQDIAGPVTQAIGLNGYFHGGGHKITVEMNGSPTPPFNFSLFFSSGFGIDSLTVDGNITNGVAGIATQGGGPITYCTSNVNIVSPGGAGGISYTNYGIISNCVFNCSITGANQIGGIAGENSGHIINCINNGKITATNSGSNTGWGGVMTSNNGVGGIVGYIANASLSISNNVNLGVVEGQYFVGGIIGCAYGLSLPTSVTNNTSYGFVKGTNAVGGIVGNVYNNFVNVSNNFSSSVVIGVSEVGCIVGRNNGGTLINNHYDKQMCGE